MNTPFYSTAAQVIPVLLLVVALELNLARRPERERVVDSIWLVGFIVGMIVAEMLSILALLEERSLSTVENALIVTMILYGVWVIAFLPVSSRMRAIREAFPLWLWVVLEYAFFLAVVSVTFLSMFGMIAGRRLGEISAIFVFALIVGSRAVHVSRRRDGDGIEVGRGRDDDDD